MAERTMVRTDGLRAHGRNYNRHGAGQVGDLARSLERFGQRKPITTWRGQIITGHGVVEAARRLGWSEVWAEACPDEWTEAEALAWLAADNELARAADPDEAQLAALVAELGDIDAELARLAAGGEERLKELLASAGSASGEDPGAQIDRAEELRVKWGVETGQLWQLGDHRLICGDCTDAAVVARVMGGERAAMVFADPPYGVNIVAANGYVRGSVGASNIVAVGKYSPVIGDETTDTAIRAVTMFLAKWPDAIHVWWGGNYYVEALGSSSCWLVWNKETTGNFADCELAWTNQGRAAKLFTHKWNGMLRDSERERRWHPTQKPAALAVWVFETLGGAGGVVFDPFCGAGMSVIAGEQSGRMVRAVEMSADYVAVALERWATMTGQEPVLIEP